MSNLMRNDCGALINNDKDKYMRYINKKRKDTIIIQKINLLEQEINKIKNILKIK